MAANGPRPSAVSSFYSIASEGGDEGHPFAPGHHQATTTPRRSDVSTLNNETGHFISANDVSEIERQQHNGIIQESDPGKDQTRAPSSTPPPLLEKEYLNDTSPPLPAPTPPTPTDLEKQPTTPTPNADPNRRHSSSAALSVLKTTAPPSLSPTHPTNWPTSKKWVIVAIYCTLQTFVTLTSTTYVSVEYLIQERFGGSTQVLTLGQSMFIVGTAVGPAFLGPLSDIGGRKWVYVFSILLYALLNIGTALARDLPMLIVFSFLIGTAGSTALSNVAGTIADLFGDSDGAGQPMALFVLSANFGPSLGSPIGEWIGDNSHMGWRWIYWINVIIGGVFAAGLCFLPETLPRVVMQKTAEKERKQSTGVDQKVVDDQVVSEKVNVLSEMRFVATMALRIMTTEPIVIFLGLYNGFAYGLLFLYLDGVFDVFSVNNGLSPVGASLTYLNFCVGVTVTFLFVPVQTYLYKRDKAAHSGRGRPEARFLTSLVAVWLFPATLLWFAFTSTGNTSYWSPLVAGGVLGFADPLLWLSMLNYITDSYPNVAASAIAAFLIPSFLIAAGMCHAGVAMFENLSTKWAFAILGFVSFGVVALVYVLFFFGEKLRRLSRLAVS